MKLRPGRIRAIIPQVWDWLNKRWPIAPVVRWSLEEDIIGGPSYAYTFGSAILIIFVLQVTTGILQLFFYVPTVAEAYNSVSFLRTEVPFGWLLNQTHRHGADIMVLLVAIHLTRVFIFGAYKKPRELTWILGVVLAITVMALSFTGGPLPWDQKGYWEAEVGTNIPGSIPIIGSEIVNIMRGGQSMGQLTLSRLFGIHVGVLPALLGGLILLHIIAFRRMGSVGPWEESKRKITGPFWPDQVHKDTIVAIVVILLIIGMNVYMPKEFYGPADPLDSSFTPKPEWNFLFLYQALKYFHGPLEPVGVVGVPGFFVALMLILPFVDRREERNPLRRPVAMICGILFAALITTLTIIGFYSKPGQATTSSSSSSAANSSSSAKSSKEQPVTSAPAPAIEEGKKLFHSEGCIGCHTINSSGGSIGPNLSDEGTKGRSRDWLTAQIRNPKSHFPNSVMPSFSSLSQIQVDHLVDYLLSLGASKQSVPGPASSTRQPSQSNGTSSSGKSPPEAPSSSAKSSGKQAPSATAPSKIEEGKELFRSQGCIGCHTVNGSGGSLGLDLSNEGTKGRSRDWLTTQITSPKSHFPDSVMPPYSSLSQIQVNHLVDYLLSLGTSRQPTPAAAGSTKQPSPSTSPTGEQHAGAGAPPKGKAAQAAYILGNAKHGGDIFKEKCASCHGPEGTDKVPNPGSESGFVPSLNPVDKDLFSEDPETFAKNIDVFIQHGAVPPGPNPAVHMLPFGDEHQLTQQEISNVEAYILSLNGVDRTEIIRPGIRPRLFFFIVVPGMIVLMLLLGGILKCLPKSGPKQEKSE